MKSSLLLLLSLYIAGRDEVCGVDGHLSITVTSLYIAGRDEVCGVDGHLSITVTSLYIAGRDEVYGVDGHLSITVTSLYIAGRDEGRGVDGHLSGSHHYRGSLGGSHPGLCRHRWLCAGVGSCGRTREDQIR